MSDECEGSGVGKHKRGGGRKFTLTNAAIVLVLTGWSVNFGAQLAIPDYTPNTHLDSMLLAVLGFLLAGKVATDTGKSIPDQPEKPGTVTLDRVEEKP